MAQVLHDSYFKGPSLEFGGVWLSLVNDLHDYLFPKSDVLGQLQLGQVALGNGLDCQWLSIWCPPQQRWLR